MRHDFFLLFLQSHRFFLLSKPKDKRQSPGDNLIREKQERRRDDNHNEHGNGADGRFIAGRPGDFLHLGTHLTEKLDRACFRHKLLILNQKNFSSPHGFVKPQGFLKNANHIGNGGFISQAGKKEKGNVTGATKSFKNAPIPFKPLEQQRGLV
jgi:hypothetical protein